MNRYATAPEHVAACDLGPATVIVNYQSGGVHTLIGPSARWWMELAATGDPSTPTGLDASSAARLLDQLCGAGALVDAAAPTPWAPPIAGQPWKLSFGTQEAQAGWTDPPRAPRRTVLIAGLALAVTLVARHVGGSRGSMHRLLRLLRWATRRASRPATLDEATRVIHAVRRVGFLIPGRVACLEESTAAVLALAASRRRVTWCHGVAGDPIRLHAWVEVDTQPVAEPPSTLRYTPLKTVPERN